MKNFIKWFMSKVKKTKVLLAVPVHSHMENGTVKSLFELEVPKNVTMDFNYCEGYTVGLARNAIVTYALENKYDYVLWIDGDLIVPKDLLKKLLHLIESNKDCGIATGYYVKKALGEPISELFNYDEEQKAVQNVKESLLPKDGKPYEIQACGMGCSLVSCDTIRKVLEKFGMCFEYVLEKFNILSEDLDFCRKVKTLENKKIYADTSLRCGHIGRGIF